MFEPLLVTLIRPQFFYFFTSANQPFGDCDLFGILTATNHLSDVIHKTGNSGRMPTFSPAVKMQHIPAVFVTRTRILS